MHARTVRPLLFVALILFLAMSRSASAAPRNAQVTGMVNLNTASADELAKLPGVGPKKAMRIIDQRQKHKFAAVDQLTHVKGFGRVSFRKLKAYLTITGPTTLAPSPASTPPAAAARGGKAKASST